MKGLSLLLALTTMGLSAVSWAGEQIDESMSADGISVVNIENMRGKVTIIGTDDDQVSAKGELGENAERFVFKKSGNMLKVKVVVKDRHNHRNDYKKGSVFTVRMPSDIRMNLDGVSTDVKVSNLSENTEVKTVSGDIDAEKLAENIELTTVSGDINSNNLKGKVRLSSVSGSIVDKNSSGRLQLKSVSGSVKTRSSAQELALSAVSGDIDFVLKEVEELVISIVSGDVDGSLTLLDNGELKVSGVSSDIELEFQDNVNADFRLRASAGGDIVNRITDKKATRAKYGPSSKLDFITGHGNASVRASVVSGEIKVSSR
ncbi:DUF4097 family beta strand repeat protein [Thalassotalea sp. M1531]|uniref:DUF4097 family beta strand repeat protein n=1 Tax=Thalassotalea algicola TaxID=2716224 RepID=A0A7Y0Q8S1_9GAMM|nr:DUF4097 family beta strand repeat-containing protein [Thalassotalea algicola]NMP33531.1 DUF4097 family beta strand repeat protein [Thalassotalea algicola]